jgi:tetratricopeptide (TPR) repeat protein
MPEQEPDDKSQAQEPSAADATPTPAREHRARPRSLTPEQRRLLGTPRPLHERVERELRGESDTSSSLKETNFDTSSESTEGKFPSPSKTETEERKPPSLVRRASDKSSRAIEMQHATLIIGALLVLCLTFYVGKKFDYWRYILTTRNEPKLTEATPDKFPGIPVDTLIEEALADERGNHWRDATERLLAAKNKNLKYRGILFRAGKIAYDHGDFDAADKFFARAIALGENVDAANYFRGLIARQRRDLGAAERFFEAATTAEPFTADYYYYWAETLRLDHRPLEAVSRYEQAARRARGDQDVTVFQFKVRMARLEAGDAAKLKTEIEKNGNSGPLSLDWLMTSAALAIREARIDDAVRFVSEARSVSQDSSNGPGIFVACTGDMVFQDACQKHLELADICQANTTSEARMP